MIGRVQVLFSKMRLQYERRRQIALVKKATPQIKETLPYNSKPSIAAIVQHFNKRSNLSSIYASLISSNIEEIIYIDDGSIDGSIQDLLHLSQGKNQFIIRANDLFEVRTYDRAIDFARSEIIVLLQDDDLPPTEPRWIEEALKHFAHDPKLAVLGGRDGLTLRYDAASKTSLAYDALRLNGDPAQLRYVEVVNRAPMFVRKSAVKALGGIDQTFAPFQCDDVDLCLKAWQGGWHVALMPTNFVRDVGVGGMRLFNSDKVSGQALKNWRIIADRYGAAIADGEFAEAVTRAAKAA